MKMPKDWLEALLCASKHNFNFCLSLLFEKSITNTSVRCTVALGDMFLYCDKQFIVSHCCQITRYLTNSSAENSVCSCVRGIGDGCWTIHWLPLFSDSWAFFKIWTAPLFKSSSSIVCAPCGLNVESQSRKGGQTVLMEGLLTFDFWLWFGDLSV